MKTKTVFKIFGTVLFNAWLVCYGLTVLCFVMAIISKVVNPDTKNLEWNSLLILGLVLLLFFIVNALALKAKAKQKQ